ncbi:MAG TPA: glutamate--tRNA ligase [Flavobacteriales bacterium]|jgi:glutamyl-tRNA synthetase|nr:glutamate--tRNA ligase [Flavobacteriales bacterium]MBK7113627.1 glutamate--tRNA ligase [Flavobacteriales bacterium]MBK7619858.1 glutamate--tRNA ligase [Flavobacteriales bacterium]MBK8530989.1 glutamate--tRNA ligase [Flavobacteriales bacterium]MBP8876714.1 glutamate--tRNA ligase [Flavobacteriales bacterium]
MSVRVRFAPSPTGPLHMGGVRTALYNYLFAKKHGGQFLLRIEDTDRTRLVPGAEEYIKESLEWCGLTPDESPWIGGPDGPYRQSDRQGLYKQYADELIIKDKAYYAFDTPEELDAMRARLQAAGVAAPAYNGVTREHMKNSLTLSADEVMERLDRGDEHVIRLKVPRQVEVRFEDIIRGWVVVHSANVDDKVLFKSDGMPTYHLANIVDDHLMHITHVIRGEEWLPSAPVHVLIYEAFGWERPAFAHLPLILKPDGNGKLSKRDGDRLGFPVFSLDWVDPNTGEKSSGYREKGYYPDAFINMLALLGWNPGTDQEIMSMEELTRSFDLTRVHKGGAKFDPEKAKWFNQQYLRMQPDAELGTQLQELLKTQSIVTTTERATQAASLLKERATFVADMLEGTYLFTAGSPLQENEVATTELKKRWKPEAEPAIEAYINALGSLPEFTATTLDVAFNNVLQEKGMKVGQVMPIYRLFVAGRMQGPGMFDVSALLGKEEVVLRLQAGLALCRSWA